MREAERLRDWMDIFCDWKLQDSQGTWRAYLTETAELAYKGRGKDRSWEVGLGKQVEEALINALCWSLVPMHCLVGPIAVIVLVGPLFGE